MVWKGWNMLTRTLLYAIPLALLRTGVVALVAATLSLPAQAQFRDVLVFGDASLKNALDEANGLFRSRTAVGSGVLWRELGAREADRERSARRCLHFG
jgi:hypothetical protein